LAASNAPSTSRRTIFATIRPIAKIRPGGNEIGDEGEGVVGKLPYRLQHLAEPERLQREHDADEKDQPEGDVADQAAERLAGLDS
jgi:hypothetical protein